MIACTCGYHAETEADFESHILECHRLSFGLTMFCDREDAPVSSAAGDEAA